MPSTKTSRKKPTLRKSKNSSRGYNSSSNGVLHNGKVKKVLRVSGSGLTVYFVGGGRARTKNVHVQNGRKSSDTPDTKKNLATPA